MKLISINYRDGPNTWAPHQYIIIQALRALPANVTSGGLPVPGSGKSSFDLIPSGQLGLTENQLFAQHKLNPADGNFTNAGPSADVNTLNGTVFNGGNATSNEGWSHILQRELANRYITSAFCSWYVTKIRSESHSSDLLKLSYTGEQREVLFQGFYQGSLMLS